MLKTIMLAVNSATVRIKIMSFLLKRRHSEQADASSASVNDD